MRHSKHVKMGQSANNTSTTHHGLEALVVSHKHLVVAIQSFDLLTHAGMIVVSQLITIFTGAIIGSSSVVALLSTPTIISLTLINV